jgi:hypothetical protein
MLYIENDDNVSNDADDILFRNEKWLLKAKFLPLLN